MSEIPRRTIDDLRARYENEPTLNDVYVEGIFDKEVIERVTQFLNQSKRTERVVYEIDTVDVPITLVKEHQLTDGNKQRVLTLARELSTITQDCRYRCLVDRDLDHWFGTLESTNRLSWTEHVSLELYFLSDVFLKDILITTSKCQIPDWDRFYTSFISTLRTQYALRLADRSMSLNLTWMSFEKCLKADSGTISLDAEKYADRLLMANKCVKKKEEFKKYLKDWASKLTGEPKSYIRGHDLITLMAWTVGAFKGIKNYDSEIAITRLFVLLSNNACEVIKVISHEVQV